MGTAYQRPSSKRLLRQYSARCDGGRFARLMRHLLRHDRRTGLRVAGRRRELERNRSRPSLGTLCGSSDIKMIRVALPYHLRNLARVGTEVSLEIKGPVTQRSILDALEAQYPMLAGTIRDHGTQQRRP